MIGRPRRIGGRRGAVRTQSFEHSIGADFSQILADAKAGEEQAATVLYDNHVAMVFGYLRARGASNPEDQTSEVFVGMLRNLDRFDGTHADFRRWLMTIAHRRLVDNRRRRNVSRLDFVDPADLDGPAPNPAMDLRAVVVDQGLIDAFGQLTDVQQEVLALRFIADLSLEDVADITGKPVGAIKSLQHRALASVRRTMTVERAADSGS